MLRRCGVALIGVLGLSVSLAYGQIGSTLADKGQWEQGKKYLAEGKVPEAKEFFEKLLSQYPKDPDLHLFLGIISLRLRDPQTAETYLRKALVIAPDHVEARTLLGWIDLEIKRDYASAIEEYSRVVQLRPKLPEAYNNLGVAFKKKGDSAKALENFDRALELRPDYSEALSNRGWVYVEKGQWGEARSDFKRALKFNPADEGALYGLSEVLKEARDYAGAQRALSRLIARSPNFVYWLEWGEIGLVRYYWVLLIVALGLFFHSRYKRSRRDSYGRSTEEA